MGWARRVAMRHDTAGGWVGGRDRQRHALGTSSQENGPGGKRNPTCLASQERRAFVFSA